jgi:hypothetical protein
MTPGEHQAMGRRAVQDFEAGAWPDAGQSGDWGLPSGMRRDVTVWRCTALRTRSRGAVIVIGCPPAQGSSPGAGTAMIAAAATPPPEPGG